MTLTVAQQKLVLDLAGIDPSPLAASLPGGSNPSYSPHSRDSLTGMVQPSGIA